MPPSLPALKYVSLFVGVSAGLSVSSSAHSFLPPNIWARAEFIAKTFRWENYMVFDSIPCEYFGLVCSGVLRYHPKRCFIWRPWNEEDCHNVRRASVRSGRCIIHLFHPDDWGSRLLWNVVTLLPDNTASYPIRQQRFGRWWARKCWSSEMWHRIFW